MSDINKAYVSPYDEFFDTFDATHEQSASQLKEIEKYAKIFHLRDTKVDTKERVEVWEAF